MIVTKSWLNEFVDISKISAEEICDTLNKIGVEVASLKHIKVPNNVVVGFVAHKAKHPNADKLSVCEVDIGQEKKQIVCGAKNVEAGQFVAVAIEGACLPNGIKIEPTEIRSVKSFGMICSAEELGLPKLNDGIMVLDESIGELVLGKQLSSYSLFDDSLIEVELTPNRGDCLSVNGIARELAAFYGLNLKDFDILPSAESDKGIGRVLTIHTQNKLYANVSFRIVDAKTIHKQTPFLIEFRLKQADLNTESFYDKMIDYASHATGVIFNYYPEECLEKNSEDKIELGIENIDGFDCIKSKGLLSAIGVGSAIEKSDGFSGLMMLEASYVPPDAVQQADSKLKYIDNKIYHKSKRGSEPNLVFGQNYIVNLFHTHLKATFYSGCISDIKQIERKPIKADILKLNEIIGMEFDKNHIVSILTRLFYDVTINAEFDSCIIRPPEFRHDIHNEHDLAEEILRLHGIDNIEPKPLLVKERAPENESAKKYYKLRNLRQKAVSAGFFENISFLFTDEKLVCSLGFETLNEPLSLLNPITSELNTLRPSLIPQLLEAASKNVKNSIGMVKLFEAGGAVDATRQETSKIAFIFSGESEKQSVLNSGKPKKIDFQTFAALIADIIGDIELRQECTNKELLHPYLSAMVVQNGVQIGFLGKICKKAEGLFELGDTFVCEILLDKIATSAKVIKPFAKYQKSVRDLTLLVPKKLSFKEIKEAVMSLGMEELIEFFAVDYYEDSKDKEHVGLTVRLVLQSFEKTFQESDISEMTEKLLGCLNERFGLKLK